MKAVPKQRRGTYTAYEPLPNDLKLDGIYEKWIEQGQTDAVLLCNMPTASVATLERYNDERLVQVIKPLNSRASSKKKPLIKRVERLFIGSMLSKLNTSVVSKAATSVAAKSKAASRKAGAEVDKLTRLVQTTTLEEPAGFPSSPAVTSPAGNIEQSGRTLGSGVSSRDGKDDVASARATQLISFVRLAEPAQHTPIPMSEGLIKELKVTSADLSNLAVAAKRNLSTEKALAAWSAISQHPQLSLQQKVLQMIHKVIPAVRKSQDLRVTTITREAMLGLLWEPGERLVAGQRAAELDLDPICGLALAMNPRLDRFVKACVDGAPESKSTLPLLRSICVTRSERTVEDVQSEEKCALAPLLQPVRLLGGAGAGRQHDTMQRMARRLWALRSAVQPERDYSVLKGLVVESELSARLVLLVENPQCEWECWITPRIAYEHCVVSCIALAVLQSGPKLAKTLLWRDRTHGGTVSAQHGRQQRRAREEGYECLRTRHPRGYVREEERPMPAMHGCPGPEARSVRRADRQRLCARRWHGAHHSNPLVADQRVAYGSCALAFGVTVVDSQCRSASESRI
jgi:hypothetical protein